MWCCNDLDAFLSAIPYIMSGGTQGACTDGQYVYQAELFDKKAVDGHQAIIIYKIDASRWEITAKSDYLPLDPASVSILDADFKPLASYEGNDLGIGKQCLDCDDEYIYLGDSGVLSSQQ